MKVITYGTFDLFHYGHYNLLKRAKDLGDYLIVGVSSDEMCKRKGKVPILNIQKRMEIISNLRFVNQVIVENNMAQKIDDISREKIDIFVLGSDYDGIFQKMDEYEKLLALGCKVVFLPRTEGVSSTELKKKLAEQNMLDFDKNSLHNMTTM